MAENNTLQKDTGKGADRLAAALAGVLTQEAQRQQAMQQLQQQQAMIEAQRQYQALQAAKDRQFQQAIETGKQQFEQRVFNEQMRQRREEQIANQRTKDRELDISQQRVDEIRKQSEIEKKKIQQQMRASNFQYLQGVANLLGGITSDPITQANNPELTGMASRGLQSVLQRVGQEFGIDLTPKAPAPVAEQAQTAAPQGKSLFDKAVDFFGFGDTQQQAPSLGTKVSNMFDKQPSGGAGRSF